MTILIVEDEGLIRSMLTEFLQDEGYRVATARNGLEALGYLREHAERARVILLDLEMPGMSGWEFRREQQRDAKLAAVPVILMSATMHLDLSAEALNVAECLDKPIDLRKLLDIVAQYAQ